MLGIILVWVIIYIFDILIKVKDLYHDYGYKLFDELAVGLSFNHVQNKIVYDEAYGYLVQPHVKKLLDCCSFI